MRFVLVKSGLRFCSRCKFTHIFCNTQLPFYRLWNKTHHSWLKCSKFVLNLLKLLLRYHYLACDGFAGYYGFHYIYASGQAVERYGVAFCLCYNSACCRHKFYRRHALVSYGELVLALRISMRPMVFSSIPATAMRKLVTPPFTLVDFTV